MIQKDTAMGKWWLAASLWQCAHSCITSCAEVFAKTANHPGDSAPLQLRFGALWLLAFPETNITFEREEVPANRWNSRKYDGAADDDWENYVRSQGAYSEGDWDVIVLCTVFLVSSPIHVSVFHITWPDTFWTDLVHHIFLHLFVGGCLGCHRILPAVNTAAVNMGPQRALWSSFCFLWRNTQK